MNEEAGVDEKVCLVEKSTEDQFRQDDVLGNQEMGVFGADQLHFESILRRILEKFQLYLQESYNKLFAESMIASLQEEEFDD